MSRLELIATAAFGLEAVVARELEALGYEGLQVEDGRVRFIGSLTRPGVLELCRAADAAVLSSSWENFPHTVVEALAAGTPMIATAVGGVAEIVRDDVNGLLVPPGDAVALAEAISRFVADDALSARLRAAATASVEALRADVVYPRLERILATAASR